MSQKPVSIHGDYEDFRAVLFIRKTKRNSDIFLNMIEWAKKLSQGAVLFKAKDGQVVLERSSNDKKIGLRSVQFLS